jgi:predicted AlkP superfamily pyrophosphatase or phosphodiesterase
MRLLGLALSVFLAVPAAAAPKLLVVISVDQMRADYFDRFASEFKKGFKELFDHGAVYTKARHGHVPTETGPGHSVILTGKFLDKTGIIGNDWWDVSRGSEVYCVADSVHKLGPENLETYTLGDALKAKGSGSFVVSLSQKDRSAILLGGMKADTALWWDKKSGDFVTSTYYGKPAWLDAFNAKEKAEGGALAPLKGKYKDYLTTPGADKILLDLAQEAVTQYGLGTDSNPDILAVSFSATDYVGHKYGPDGKEMKAQLISLDGYLGELFAFLDQKVGKGNYDVALTADHGVMPLPEGEWGKANKAQRIIDEEFAESYEKALQKVKAGAKKWVVGFFHPNVYLNKEQAAAMKLDWGQFLRDAATALSGVEGIEHVYIPGQWDDEYGPAYRRGYFPGRSGDLVVRQKSTVLVAFDKTSATHGSPYDYDAQVPLIFWGPDFKTGLYARPAMVVDLAPTAAKALGVDFPPGEGSRVLTESLRVPAEAVK